jgi:hypothetical protein
MCFVECGGRNAGLGGCEVSIHGPKVAGGCCKLLLHDGGFSFAAFFFFLCIWSLQFLFFPSSFTVIHTYEYIAKRVRDEWSPGVVYLSPQRLVLVNY